MNFKFIFQALLEPMLKTEEVILSFHLYQAEKVILTFHLYRVYFNKEVLKIIQYIRLRYEKTVKQNSKKRTRNKTILKLIQLERLRFENILIIF